jgi:hypothetical protein
MILDYLIIRLYISIKHGIYEMIAGGEGAVVAPV